MKLFEFSKIFRTVFDVVCVGFNIFWLQTNFFPELIQVNVLPEAMAVVPAFGQAEPDLTAALEKEMGKTKLENMHTNKTRCQLFQFLKLENFFMNVLTQVQ